MMEVLNDNKENHNTREIRSNKCTANNTLRNTKY